MIFLQLILIFSFIEFSIQGCNKHSSCVGCINDDPAILEVRCTFCRKANGGTRCLGILELMVENCIIEDADEAQCLKSDNQPLITLAPTPIPTPPMLFTGAPTPLPTPVVGIGQPTQSTPQEDSGLSGGIVALIAIALLIAFVLCLAFIGGVMYMLYMKQQEQLNANQAADNSAFYDEYGAQNVTTLPQTNGYQQTPTQDYGHGNYGGMEEYQDASSNRFDSAGAFETGNTNYMPISHRETQDTFPSGATTASFPTQSSGFGTMYATPTRSEGSSTQQYGQLSLVPKSDGTLPDGATPEASGTYKPMPERKKSKRRIKTVSKKLSTEEPPTHPDEKEKERSSVRQSELVADADLDDIDAQFAELDKTMANLMYDEVPEEEQK